MKIKKNQFKKKYKKNSVNLGYLWPESRDRYKPYRRQNKLNYKFQFPLNSILNDKI
jgi:hypothetical protein